MHPHWSEAPQTNTAIPGLSTADAIAEIDRELKNIADEKKRRTLNKIETFFPETGPFRRELYPKHLEFFRAGKYYRSRLFSAGNRCLTPWSPIETDRATRQCGELIGEKGFYVRSWDGNSRCTKPTSPVFLRGIEQAFLLRLDNGQEVQCSGRHQVLTAAGWLSLALLIRLSSGLRCRRKRKDFPASCFLGGRLHGGRLLYPEAFAREKPQPGEYAHPSTPVFSTWDAAERTRGYIRACQAFGRPSTRGDATLLADLCGQFGDPSSYIAAQWSRDELRAVRQSEIELVRRERGPRCRSVPSFAMPPLGNAPLSLEGSEPSKSTKSSGWRLFDRLEVLQTSGAEFLEDADRNETFVPLSGPDLYGGTSILSVHRIGYQPIIDFTVRDTHCYESQGVISHNCGKTTAGAFELASHLAGIYPDWWPGRRFTEPIQAWACGTTNETTKNVVQAELLGRLDKDDSVSDGLIGMGTGMIPAARIVGFEAHAQIRGAMKSVWVRHVTGRRSLLQFKSYEQTSVAFEGSAQHVIWGDEEIPLDVYTECIMRLMTTGGMFYSTSTPLRGLTDIVQQFMPDGIVPEWQTCDICGKQLMEIGHECRLT